ncbi:MAG: HEAT repeat domain-containing protein [Gemmatimonadaceae bacterium]
MKSLLTAALLALCVPMAAEGATMPALDSLARASWAPDDPADSLYKLARGALNDGDYDRAAELFERITSQFPRSQYAGDAFYWRAFALYREGGSENLKEALKSLEQQGRRFPKAATRSDAKTLATRIQGTLARSYGDAKSAESLQQKGADAGTGCPSEDDDEDMRIAALNALLQMDSERAVPILKKVLARRDECAEGMRRKAVFLLSQKSSPETADILLDIAQNDPSHEVQEQAVFWLSQVDDDRVVGMLSRLLQSAKDEDIKDKAIFALAEHRGGRGQDVLREYVQRESEPVELREKAIFWLGQKSSRENADFLKTLFGKVRSEELKEKVLFSLSQMKGEETERWLLEVASNKTESEEVRKKALFWAGQAGASMQALGELYGRMTEREMKEQLIFVYSQRRERAAVDKLMDIARNDADRELRKKAVFWLSQSRDPRVATFLLEIIDR